MMKSVDSSSAQGAKASQPGTHPLVFVISAFLIGLGVGDAGLIGNVAVILAGATCGVITFVFLESLQRRERREAEEAAVRAAEKQMAVRLNRHVPPAQMGRPMRAVAPPHYGVSLVRSPLSLRRR